MGVINRWVLTDTLGKKEVIDLPAGEAPFIHDHVVEAVKVGPRFQLDPVGKYSKFAMIEDKWGGYLMARVDTDDVPREVVLKQAELICDILNENSDRIPEDYPYEEEDE